ncbi:MAG: serine hydrolase [Proteobacteria bacterium]|jgi:serine-type D-Ala-D-Ala endopeptidase (penicillin-binding protein 7)|nr:serine hydrolase [Pseudomonadota bacterium]MBK7114545.1 serine hydrolase [Pseudomonadota bacterium]MBK9253276.1 serine hydrolase [Pseudomonadota bacterium]MCC6632183.1 serine hydrolase [Gammaproteobacteria bacterium]
MQKPARTLLTLLLVVSSLGCIAGAPDVRSRSVLVWDRAEGRELFARGADQAVPIASITKLMTALVVLDARQPLDERLKVTAQDRIRGRGGASRIPVGAVLTRADLLRLALMSSENLAANVLGRNYPGGKPAFIRAMNARAVQLGMSRSRFVDPAGLSGSNVASARDVSRLVMAASQHPRIREFSTAERHAVALGKRQLEFRNTDSLVRDPGWEVVVQKTGFLTEAGKCLALQARIQGRDVVIVLLNSWGKYTRVADARRIRKWMESRAGG